VTAATYCNAPNLSVSHYIVHHEKYIRDAAFHQNSLEVPWAHLHMSSHNSWPLSMRMSIISQLLTRDVTHEKFCVALSDSTNQQVCAGWD